MEGLPANWGRGKRFQFQGLGGLKVWIDRQQEIKANKAAKVGRPKTERDWSGEKLNNFDSPFECSRAYMEKLRKKGWQQIGSGAYSSVYSHPKGDCRKVLKVNRSLDPWLEWVMWAKENGWEQFAPKVHSYRLYRQGQGKCKKSFYVAIVERLDHNSNEDPDNPHFMTGDLFYALARNGGPYAKLYADLIAPGLSDFCIAFHDRFKGYGKDYWGQNNMISMDKKRFILNDPIHHKGTRDREACNDNVPLRYKEVRQAA
jgi:hypothetical protein